MTPANTSPNVLVIGTGNFSKTLCQSLVLNTKSPLRVHVVGRRLDRAFAVASSAHALARQSGSPLDFVPGAIGQPRLPHHSSPLQATVRQTRPTIVIVCASEQSPAETHDGRTAWSDVLLAAGFGVTLPFQCAVAVEAARASADLDATPAVINAAFPDVVNPVLRALGLPIFTGVGNIAALDVAMRAALGLRDASQLKLLGHHVHLAAPRDLDDELLAWLDERPLSHVREALGRIRAAPRAHVNMLSAWLAGALVSTLVDDTPFEGHVPGPLGLPGGYPVSLSAGRLSLNLPSTQSESNAIAWNQRMCELDGVRLLDTDRIAFSDRVVETLRGTWPGFPGEVPISEIEALKCDLLRLRAEQRRKPSRESKERPLALTGWGEANDI